MSDQTVKATEMDLDAYDFGDPAAPEGFDPESKSFENTPPGVHVFELVNFEIVENNAFNGKDFGTWIGNQIRPRLVVPTDHPHAGTSQIDFLPMPSPGKPMPKALANRWANFLRGLGFKCPADRVVPKGFKLADLLNGNDPGKPPTKPYHRTRAEVVEEEYDGKKRLKIKYFGYEPVTGNGNGNGTPSTGVPKKPAPASKPAASKPATPAPDPLDLDNL